MNDSPLSSSESPSIAPKKIDWQLWLMVGGSIVLVIATIVGIFMMIQQKIPPKPSTNPPNNTPSNAPATVPLANQFTSDINIPTQKRKISQLDLGLFTINYPSIF